MKKDKTIFHLDDDYDDHFFLCEAVKAVDSEYQFIHMCSFSALISHIEEEPAPNFIIVDMHVPLGKGVQDIARLKSLNKIKNVPLIVLSGSSNWIDINNAFEAGSHVFVVKPFYISQLQRAIKEIINQDWSDTENIKKQYFVDGNSVELTEFILT